MSDVDLTFEQIPQVRQIRLDLLNESETEIHSEVASFCSLTHPR